MKAILTLILSVALVTGASAVQPVRFNYQAKLTDSNGIPLQGSQECILWIYEGGTAGEANSGKLRYKETATLPAVDGVVNHAVGTGTPEDEILSASLFETSDDLFVQLAVGLESNVVLPRQRIESVPFAINAANADRRIPISDPGDSAISITQPGSYYLTGNVSGPGIVIASDRVVFDLNGYELDGAGTAYGIQLDSCENVSIYNGTIHNYVIGIGTDGSHLSLRDLRIVNCTQAGIFVGGASIVEDVIVQDISGGASIMRGISVGDNSIVRRCSVGNITAAFNDNSVYGIKGGNSSLVQSCNVNGLFGGGDGKVIHGIDVVNFSKVTDCTANNCLALGSGSVDAVGIYGTSGCLVSGNTCENNLNATDSGNAFGIEVGGNSIVTRNNCYSNRHTANGTGVAAGISIPSRCRVEENHCTNSTGSGSNQNYGIYCFQATGTGTSVIRNTTSANTNAGIRFENTAANPAAVNYHAENIIDEATPISSAGGSLVAGTGDRANVNF